MLHVIREFAIERLEASGEAEMVRRGHAVFYERQATHWRAHIAAQTDAAVEPAQQAKHAWIEAERDNLRLAMAWALEHGEPAIGLSVARTHMTFWMRRGLFVEGRRWLEGLLALPPPAGAESEMAPDAEQWGRLREHQAHGYNFVGTLAGEQGGADNQAHAADLLEEAARRFRELGDLVPMVEVLLNLAGVLADLGEVDRAYTLAEECLRTGQQLGLNGARHAMNLAAVGQLAFERNDLQRAQSCSLEALRLTEHAGRPWERPIFAYWTLARVALRQGNLSEAQTRVRDALKWIAERDGNVARAIPTLELFCLVDAAVGKHARVAYVQGALELPTRRYGAEALRAWKRDLEAVLAQSRATIGEEAWQAAYATGHTHSLEEIVAELLQTSD